MKEDVFTAAPGGIFSPGEYESTPAVTGPWTSASNRFWSKVAIDDGCWLWTGAVKQPSKRRGPGSSRKRAAGGRELPYGQFSYQGRTVQAHKFAFAEAHCRDIRGIGLISHSCDNPRCVRPSHLSESTHSANNREAYERGRKPVTVPRRTRCI